MLSTSHLLSNTIKICLRDEKFTFALNQSIPIERISNAFLCPFITQLIFSKWPYLLNGKLLELFTSEEMLQTFIQGGYRSKFNLI